MALHSQKQFDESRPANYDGLFNWDWLQAVLPRKIKPMDIDAFTEIGGRLLCWETKKQGVLPSKPQAEALKQLVAAGRGKITVLVHAKSPEEINYVWALYWMREEDGWAVFSKTPASAADVKWYVKRWAEYADVQCDLKENELLAHGWRRVKTIRKPATTWRGWRKRK